MAGFTRLYKNKKGIIMEAKKFYFVSNKRYKGLKIFSEGIVDDNDKVTKQKMLANFQPQGNTHGTFVTEDEEVAKKLRENKQFSVELSDEGYGSGAFTEVESMEELKFKYGRVEIIKGTRTTVDPNEAVQLRAKIEKELKEEQKVDINEAVRYGELKNKLPVKGGGYRKDSTKEEIEEFETLKLKYGV